MRRTRTVHLAPALLAVALASAAASAQAPAEPAPAAGTFPGFAPRAAVQRFVGTGTGDWLVRWDVARGVPELLFGARRELSLGGLTDAHFERAARQLVDELSGALGFDARVLELVRVKRLALSRVGGTDKVAVALRQVVDGVEVHGARVNVVFSDRGELLALDNQALPHVAQTELVPTVDLGAAARVARERFAADTARAVAAIEPSGYVLFGARSDPRKDAIRAAPAYLFVVRAVASPAAGQLEVIREYAIAARGAPAVLGAWSLTHEADLTGTTQGWGQLGLLPDGQDPAGLAPLADVRLATAGEPDVFSGPGGAFVISGVAGAQTVTATLDGQYSEVINDQGAEASVSALVSPGSPATLTFNAGLTEFETAQVNVHRAVGFMRDWIRSIDPDETIVDFPLTSFVNIADTCNAQWAGDHMNFFAAGDGCVNTGFSTVVYHEEGHWLNALYGSGNDFLGFGEGGADVWAMYAADDPIVGNGFHGPGTNVRSGLNTEPFCGNDDLGCQGESHSNGLPLMGALWKARQGLKDSLGAGPGGDLADALLLAWHQVFDDVYIRTTLRDHWLVLDDDDGQLGNGTPHMAAIDGGFVAHGFPAFQPPVFAIAPLAAPDVVGHEGPVAIAVDVGELFDTVATADVHYSTDGGQSFLSTPMGFDGGTGWTGLVPGQISPAVVQYYVEVTSAGGVVNRLPATAPRQLLHYDVGVRTVVRFDDFEGPDDAGWTHVLLTEQDDWQRGLPTGQSTDPSSARSGTSCWGNDIGGEGWNGSYRPDTNNALLSPVLDLGAHTGTRLRFWRWLGVEESEYDRAEILVDGTPIWVNPFAGHVVDAEWTWVDYDISALADGDPSVQISFELTSDGGLELGGWNIDDLSVVTLVAVDDTDFIPYGTGTPGTGGQSPLLTGSGQAVPGGPIALDVTGARPDAISALFVGTDQIAVPGLGGTFLVGNLLLVVDLLTNGAGAVHLPAVVPDDPLLSGLQLTLQFWVADPAGPAGKAASNGLLFVIE